MLDWFKSWYDKILESVKGWFEDLQETLKDFFEEWLQWLYDFVLWLPRKLWQELLEALNNLIHYIPVPDFFADAGTAMASIPSGVAFFAQVGQFNYGLTVVITALTIRFLIRRIPLVG